jgi:hypothetical protein
MNYKKLVILLLALFLSINFVCAADNASNETLDMNLNELDEISANNNENNISFQQSENLSSNDVLAANAEPQMDEKLKESREDSSKSNLKLYHEGYSCPTSSTTKYSL